MESQNKPTTRTVSRRTLARGAAWSLPIVASAAVVPAYALSPGCFLQTWAATISGAPGSRNMTTTVTKIIGTAETLTVTVSQSRSAGVGSYYDPVNNLTLKETAPQAKSTTDFVGATVGQQVAATSLGAAPKASQGNAYTIPGGSTSSVLTLNQGTDQATTPAVETLTWTFTDSTGKAVTPKNVSFNVYDVTQVSGASPESQNYTDQVTFSGATMTVTSQTGPTKATVGANSLTGTVPSASSGSYATVSLTGFTNNGFSLTYRNSGTPSQTSASAPVPRNSQYIGLSDLTICF